MRILAVSSMICVLAVLSPNGVAGVDQRCASVLTSTCNSALARCQCTSSGRSKEPDNVAEQQRRCAQDCQEAYQKCLADVSRSCYR